MTAHNYGRQRTITAGSAQLRPRAHNCGRERTITATSAQLRAQAQSYGRQRTITTDSAQLRPRPHIYSRQRAITAASKRNFAKASRNSPTCPTPLCAPLWCLGEIGVRCGLISSSCWVLGALGQIIRFFCELGRVMARGS